MYIEEINRFGEMLKYRVVETIPNGYSVWSIGGIEGSPNYMPLCICYSGTYKVQTDKLCAILVPEPERKVMEKCQMRTGCGNLHDVKQALTRKRTKDRDLLELALPLFEKYTL